MVSDLFAVLRLGVTDDVGDEVEEDILEELEGEHHLGPVVTLFHNVQHITCSKKGARVRPARRDASPR